MSSLLFFYEFAAHTRTLGGYVDITEFIKRPQSIFAKNYVESFDENGNFTRASPGSLRN